MVLQLAHHVQTCLHQHNKPQLSFYDKMMANKRKEEERTLAAEQQKLRREIEANKEREEDEVWRIKHLKPHETIATFWCDIWQHCWMHRILSIWPPSYDMLLHVGCWPYTHLSQQHPICYVQQVTAAAGWPKRATCCGMCNMQYVALKCCVLFTAVH